MISLERWEACDSYSLILCSRSRTDFCRDSSSPGKLNFRGRDDETRDERDRFRLRIVDDRVDTRVMGRDKELRTAAVVLSTDVIEVMYWRSGEESEEEVER